VVKRINLIMASVVLCSQSCFSVLPEFSLFSQLSDGTYCHRVNDLSADGTIVVGQRTINGYFPMPFWLSKDVGLRDVGNTTYAGVAYGLSPNGTTVVGQITNVITEETSAYKWTQADGLILLGYLGTQTGSYWSSSYGASYDGSIIVGRSTGSNGNEAFLWTASEGMVGLGHLDKNITLGRQSGAYAISADGSTVVGYSGYYNLLNGKDIEPFLWNEQRGMIGLGHLPGGDSDGYATCVSSDGSLIAGYSSSFLGREAFIWREETGIAGLGIPANEGFRSTMASRMSADGNIIVGWGHIVDSHLSEAFIWDEVNGIRNLTNLLENEYGLDLMGWRLRDASGISDDGKTIIGWAERIDGAFHEQGYYIVTIPEPSTLLFLSGGFLCLRRIGNKLHKSFGLNCT